MWFHTSLPLYLTQVVYWDNILVILIVVLSTTCEQKWLVPLMMRYLIVWISSWWILIKLNAIIKVRNWDPHCAWLLWAHLVRRNSFLVFNPHFTKQLLNDLPPLTCNASLSRSILHFVIAKIILLFTLNSILDILRVLINSMTQAYFIHSVLFIGPLSTTYLWLIKLKQLTEVILQLRSLWDKWVLIFKLSFSWTIDVVVLKTISVVIS